MALAENAELPQPSIRMRSRGERSWAQTVSSSAPSSPSVSQS
jgi:hypothetical protein